MHTFNVVGPFTPRWLGPRLERLPILLGVLLRSSLLRYFLVPFPPTLTGPTVDEPTSSFEAHIYTSTHLPRCRPGASPLALSPFASTLRSMSDPGIMAIPGVPTWRAASVFSLLFSGMLVAACRSLRVLDHNLKGSLTACLESSRNRSPPMVHVIPKIPDCSNSG